MRLRGLFEPTRGDRIRRGAPRRLRNRPEADDVLRSYDALLTGFVPTHAVVLGGGEDSVALGTALHRAYPGSRVTVLLREPAPAPADRQAAALDVLPCRKVAQAHDALLRRPAPDLLVDDGGQTASTRYGCFLHLLPALAEGGRYLLVDGGASEGALDDRDGKESLPELLDRLGRLTGAGAEAEAHHPDDLHRVRMLGPRTRHGRVLEVVKLGRHLAKVREEEVDEVLAERFASSRVETLERRARHSFATRATLRTNRPELEETLPRAFDVPDRALRVQHDVVCHRRQLAVAGDVVLPASFHHPQAGRPRNRATVDASRWYAGLAAEPGDVPVLPGTWYHLASEFPGHFGHVMSEDLSRLWGWDEARRRYPDVKVLLGAGDPPAPAFVHELLQAYGIDREDVVSTPTPVRVERLVTATPQLHNGKYVDPDLALTWQRVARGLVDPDLPAPRRIFVARPDGGERRCLNADELEARFVAAGFRVVRPETMTLVEQFSMFAGAEAVAGYAGSGLFTAIASRPGTPLVVFGSDSYYAVNEWLISSANALEHHQVWGPSSVPKSSGAFERTSFHADFRIDLERDRGLLDEIIDRVRA